MRISDWSSDVCSSDLDSVLIQILDRLLPRPRGICRLAHNRHLSYLVWGQGRSAKTFSKAVPIAAGAAFTVSGIGFRHLRQLGLSLTTSASVVSGSLSIKRSEEHTSELQSLMRISYAVFCLK